MKSLRRLVPFAVLLAAAAASPVRADDPPEAWSPTGLGARFTQTQTPLTNDRGMFEANIWHRFYTPSNQAKTDGLLGLDGGANVTLGIDYTFVKNLAFQMFRSGYNADYELALKWTALRPAEKLPLAIGVRGGVDWWTASYLQQDSTFFGQVLISYTIADRVTIGIAPSYVEKTSTGLDDVFAVPVVAQIKLTNSIAAIGEYVARNKDIPNTVGQWSFGVEKAVYRHKFSLWIGNSGAITVDQRVGGDYLGGLTESNIRLGFNIMRQFDIAAE